MTCSWITSDTATRAAAIALVLLHFVMGWSALRYAAPTADEYSYIATAYIYTQTGDFRLDRTHPPLLRLWMGIPLQALSIHTPPLREDQWDAPESNIIGYLIGWEMLLGGENEWRTLLTAARLPILLLSCGLGWILFRWAQALYGNSGGLLTLFLYSFSPNILAHASLATMDLGTCFFFVAVLFSFFHYTQSPSVWKLILAGGLLGCALAAKVTALILIPPLGAAWCYHEYIRKRRTGGYPLGLGYQGMMMRGLLWIGSGLAVLFLIYGYPFQPFYYGDTLQNVLIKSTQTGGEPIPGMPHRNYAFYLWGEYSTSGWFYYYLAALLMKTPIAAMVLFIPVIVCAPGRWSGSTHILITGTLFTLLFASMFNRVNIGLRHILPVYPLLFLYLGHAAVLPSKALRGVVVPGLLFWYLCASLWIMPHYLAYFNEAVGGPANAPFLLDDSNIDWGQDLAALSVLQTRYPKEPLYVAPHWMFRPEAFGVEAEILKPEDIPNPPRGIVAVGKHWAVRQRMHARSPYYFDWLEKYQPIDHLGHSILVYRFE